MAKLERQFRRSASIPSKTFRDATAEFGGPRALDRTGVPTKPFGLPTRYPAFMAQRFEQTAEVEEKDVDKTLHYEQCSPSMKKLIDEAREAEWSKYMKYSAAVSPPIDEGRQLVSEGHTLIPSK